MTTPLRILFVNGDARVRESLRRECSPVLGGWELLFEGDGARALEIVSTSEIDVIVTGMALPGLPGPDLLREVMQRRPRTVRFVLASLSEQPMVMACAAATHQYLTLPCEPRVLRNAVTRALDMDAALRREKVARLVGRLERLPSLPDLYVRMVERMADPECSIDEIGDLVARDISMTARILKLVNSAFFGLRQHVASPREAVNYLGLDSVKALVLSINAFAQYEDNPLGGISLETLWNHSLMTAGYAKVIGRAEAMSPREIEESFVSGMLHDTGKLVFAANFSSDYADVFASIAESSDTLIAAEESVFDANHAEIGGHLLRLWGLPEPIVDAVTWHHQPARCPEQSVGPLTCVHVANVWSHLDSAHAPAAAQLDSGYLDRLGLTGRVRAWRHMLEEEQSSDVISA